MVIFDYFYLNMMVNIEYSYFSCNTKCRIDEEDIVVYRTTYFKLHNADEIIPLLSTILNTSHDGLFVSDSNGYPLFYNDALLEITGLTSEYLNSKKANVFYSLKQKKVPNAGVAIALEKKQTSSIIVDYENGRKALITATPSFNQNGEIQFVVSNVRDITEINLLQNELEETKQINKVYKSTLEQLKNEMGSRQQFIFKSKSMEKVISQANRFAENNLAVLLLGESGVGKDVLANYIHEVSNRKGSFVKINCGAIPEHLLESELFGYEKGAFTGANQSKKGLIELANHGTLFLDEIGDLPYSLQVKLLNVLQDYKVRRLGSTITKEVDVRVIAATNIDLESLIAQKGFRPDLYYRLNVLSITVPPLRERKEVIPGLVIHFLNSLEEKYKTKKVVHNQVLEKFMNYHWPGNIRELKNTVERLYHLSENNLITLEYLPEQLQREDVILLDNHNEEVNLKEARSLKEAVTSFENEYISLMLSRTSSLQECANLLGISLSTLVRKKRNILI
jgi:PAS domain S-box-containing protein